jgi:hypothetical protein
MSSSDFWLNLLTKAMLLTILIGFNEYKIGLYIFAISSFAFLINVRLLEYKKELKAQMNEIKSSRFKTALRETTDLLDARNKMQAKQIETNERLLK